MDEELLSAFADEEKLMPYLHLPVQAGSDRILKAMNRKHTAAEYVALIERLRNRCARISPFRETSSSASPVSRTAISPITMQLVEAVGYASAFSFKYSRRPRHAGRGHGRPGGRSGEDRASGAPCRRF